ncbi:hypothetical protein ILUMI_20337 [Ignelater luminosus]|uniref:Uncharacterized protein n=1 Tax=Ignelater luminosus TaxID=2038154 RepID=A0A8K0CIN0_IGNLU|nr:hypothetical protein ILUMI_20337 [Ignelater luminosus]
MVISKTPIQPEIITAYEEQLERTGNVIYLGCRLNDNWNISKEIRIITEKARTQDAIYFRLLYGIEGWTLTDTLLRKLKAFERRLYMRVLLISWMDRIRNEIVLQRINKDTEEQ